MLNNIHFSTNYVMMWCTPSRFRPRHGKSQYRPANNAGHIIVYTCLSKHNYNFYSLPFTVRWDKYPIRPVRYQTQETSRESKEIVYWCQVILSNLSCSLNTEQLPKPYLSQILGEIWKGATDLWIFSSRYP